MEEGLRQFATATAIVIEAAAIVAVALGAAEAIWYTVREFASGHRDAHSRRAIWVRFAGWIIMGLEFTLGADIIRTAVAPSWDEIGKLAAIAAIRTALNYFLERDVEQAIKAHESV